MADWNLRLILNRIWGERPVGYRSWAVQRTPSPLAQAFWRRFDVTPARCRAACLRRAARAATRGSVSSAPDSPYKGLTAFDDSELDALLFFGREREREIVVANLIASRLTVLYGPSGVGKSSLLRAVRRSLAARAAGGAAGRRLLELERRSGRRRSHRRSTRRSALRRRLARDAVERGTASVTSTSSSTRRRSTSSTSPATPTSRSPERCPLSLARPLRVNVLISLREDALAKLDRFAGRIPGLFANTLRLDRLDRESARAAIVGPLQRYNELTGERVSLEPELVEAVLDQVSAGRIEAAARRGGRRRGASRPAARIEAPYLQLVMQRIWEEERAAGSECCALATLERLGGAQRIVEEHLERAMSSLSSEQRDVAARIFGHLVTPSGTKISHEESDLVAFAQVDVDELHGVLDGLVRERILRSDEDGAAIRYEIFHDVLAQPVLAWRTRHRTEREIEHQVEERARRKSRMQRLLALGVGLAVILVGAILFAVLQQRNADEKSRDAHARTLDASAIALLTEDPELSLLLARESARLAPGPTAEDALLQSLLTSRVRATSTRPGRYPRCIRPAKDAVVYVDADGVFHVVSVATGEILRSMSDGGARSAFRGRTFAVVRSDGAPPQLVEMPSGRCAASSTLLGGAAADASAGRRSHRHGSQRHWVDLERPDLRSGASSRPNGPDGCSARRKP